MNALSDAAAPILREYVNDFLRLAPTIDGDELNAGAARALRDRADMNWRTSERDLEEEGFVLQRLADPRT